MATIKMGAPVRIDYDSIEADWRAGIKSSAQMAGEYNSRTGQNITGHAIAKHFKKQKVDRDLTAKIRARADALVTKRLVTDLVTHGNEVAIVEANALEQSTIINKQRATVSRNSSILLTMIEEIEHQVNNREDYEKLGEIMFAPNDKGEDKLNDIYRKTVSFNGRVENIKKLTETLKVSTELERKVYKIDDEATADTFEGWLKKVRNVQ